MSYLIRVKSKRKGGIHLKYTRPLPAAGGQKPATQAYLRFSFITSFSLLFLLLEDGRNEYYIFW
jgi:hypothetical protein